MTVDDEMMQYLLDQRYVEEKEETRSPFDTMSDIIGSAEVEKTKKSIMKLSRADEKKLIGMPDKPQKLCEVHIDDFEKPRRIIKENKTEYEGIMALHANEDMALHSPTRLWDKLERESTVGYTYFLTYLRIPYGAINEKRSFSVLAKHVRKKTGHKIAHARFLIYAKKYNWEERVKSYDMHKALSFSQDILVAVPHHIMKSFDLAAKSRSIASDIIDTKYQKMTDQDKTDMSWRQVQSIIKTSSDLQKSSFDMMKMLKEMSPEQRDAGRFSRLAAGSHPLHRLLPAGLCGRRLARREPVEIDPGG